MVRRIILLSTALVLVALAVPSVAGAARTWVVQDEQGRKTGTVRLQSSSVGVTPFASLGLGMDAATAQEEQAASQRHVGTSEQEARLHVVKAPGVLACQYRNHIWLVSASGRRLRRLTRSGSNNPAGQTQPAWSPDGSRVAFIDYTGVTNDLGCRLWVVNADGTGQHPLDVLGDRESIANTGSGPAWSPDGTKIAFVNVMNTSGDPRNMWPAVFAYDFSTRTATQLCRVSKSQVIEGLVWTADGRKVLFSASNRWAAALHKGVRLVSRIRAVNVRTHRVTVLATAPRGTAYMGLARSPNGRQMAVALDRVSGRARSAIKIGTMGRKPTRTVVRATQAGTHYQTVSWSADGRRLAYGIFTPNGYSAWVIGTRGQSDHKILGGASFPCWRPR